MSLNYPPNPAIGNEFRLGSKVMIWDGIRWIPDHRNYYPNGESFDTNGNNITLDLTKGNIFSINSSTNATVSFINPKSTKNNRFVVKVKNNNAILSGGQTETWDLSNLTYDNSSVFVGSQEATPGAVFFKPDGTRMYIVGTTADRVFQYDLFIPWDLTTSSYNGINFLVSQEANPQGLYIRPDGTKAYIIGTTGDTIYQYTMTTPWEVATMVYDSIFFSVTTQEATPSGIFFRPDGSRVYVIGTTSDAVFQYDLEVPWQINTATYTGISFSVALQELTPTDIFFKNDGTIMYVIGSTRDYINQYSLSIPWNIQSAIFDNITAWIALQDLTPTGLYIKPDGTKLYMVGTTVDIVYQYSMTRFTPNSLITWPSNIYWQHGSPPVLPENQEEYIYEFVTLDNGQTYYGKLLINTSI